MTDDELIDDELPDDPDSSRNPTESEILDGILIDVDLNPPPELSRCPNCGGPVASVTSRGPTDHTAGPYGCSLTPGEVEQL
ncbi:hypothetical protein [Natrinema caseinilyticum]|uniref:hypothetical protein n=1 Tax=Natrinema caseinilyticum TaxID=2961570 RepID=UPI0020C29B91|nr:hypothetical protein [Natrinema caseinilyticum]